MKRQWQVQEAKNRFSEVIDLALEEGPQTVTRHGHEVVVIVSKHDFDKRKRRVAARGTLVSFLRGLAFVRSGIELERGRDRDRGLEL
ncbi:MAG TPA: type II toxin-antitoxin system prevent-host-death family antitoxin [Polyangiaceae bacterium]|jgi:prevent-host-death family protein|nr:type II toxin-antitoxin system prevent-host-death family antitoxin [Polyangiaceae bacterium]